MVRKAKKEEGATHWFKCSMGDSCGAWVEVWIPKVVPKDFLKLPLYCGFCRRKTRQSGESNRTVTESTPSVYHHCRSA